jgi:hypothetical protein
VDESRISNSQQFFTNNIFSWLAAAGPRLSPSHWLCLVVLFLGRVPFVFNGPSATRIPSVTPDHHKAIEVVSRRTTEGPAGTGRR